MNLDVLTVVLPWPDMSLMPNRKNGRHWAGTQAAKVRARDDGYYGAKQALGKNRLTQSDRVTLKVTFVAPDNRGRDIDNLFACIKPQLDGIAQALGIDDKHFRPVMLDDAVDRNKKGFLLFEIGAAG